jgi:hypothetical protein
MTNVRKVCVHAAHGSGTIRVCGEPPIDWSDATVDDEARQLEAFLADRLPVRLYNALAKKMQQP